MKNITAKKILIRPIITEKTIGLSEAGKYTFEVTPGSSKIEIAKAVTNRFNVTVLDVKTINKAGKKVTFGKNRIQGRRSDSKKAIVTLKKGDKISIFEIK